MADLLNQAASIVGQFNILDWFILLVWVVSCVYGIARGFAREALSILGWLASFLAANVLADSVADLGRKIVDEPTTRYLLAWSLTFIAVLLMVGMVAAFLSDQMRQPGFNLGNRLFGGVFGFIRGIIIIAALSVVLRAVLPDGEEDLLESAVLMDPVNWVAEWIGTNFERVLESEPSEAVRDTMDSGGML